MLSEVCYDVSFRFKLEIGFLIFFLVLQNKRSRFIEQVRDQVNWAIALSKFLPRCMLGISESLKFGILSENYP